MGRMGHAKERDNRRRDTSVVKRSARSTTVTKLTESAMSREMLAAGLAAAAAAISASPQSRKAIRNAGLSAANSSGRAVSSVMINASKLGSIIAEAVADAAQRVLPSNSESAPKDRVRMVEGEGMGTLLRADELKSRLNSIVDDESTDWASSEILGVLDAAQRIGVVRSTLDQWRRAGKVLAFSKGLRNYVFPMEQFVRSKPISGLADVRAHFETDEDAWEWLVTPDPIIKGQKPLDLLKAGQIEEVIRAAEGALDFA